MSHKNQEPEKTRKIKAVRLNAVLCCDPRPAKGAWAPGDYMCICCICREQFTGDKRAVSCANCEYE